MPQPLLTNLTVRELLDTTLAVTAELRRRGLTRTGTSLAGELMEHVVAKAYKAHLESPVNAGWDAVTEDGTRLQVKTRFLEPGVRRPITFKNYDFDAAVIVWLDSTTFTIDWARYIPVADVKRRATPYGPTGGRLSAPRAVAHEHDVTALLRATLGSLDHN